MREILFRGKERFNQQWICGNFIKRFNEYLIQNQEKEHSIAVPVISETIGQFTGLYDKNGKKVFEGDIIKTYHGTAKVVYSQTYALFGFIMLEKENHENEYDYRFTDMVIEDGIEVIGNTYDLLGD